MLSLVSDFEELSALARSSRWPEAIEDVLICDPASFEDCMIKAEAIIETFCGGELQSKKVLDFGCGEGCLALKAREYGPHLSIGFDPQGRFSPKCSDCCTSDFEVAARHAPYDVIFAYDLLDHMPLAEIGPMLRALRSLMGESSVLYLRCHPFVSRHATHLYRSLNRAYLHLVFSPSELASLALRGRHSNRILEPITYYRRAFAQVGLIWQEEMIVREEVENFFTENEAIRRRLQKTFRGTSSSFTHSMEIQLVDYKLKK